MKKFITTLLVLLCFSSNLAFSKSNQDNTLKQGVYGTGNLKNFIVNATEYKVQNISTDKEAYIIILDKNFRTVQTLYLGPNSEKYNLVTLKCDYRIAIIGDGDVYIS